MGGGSTDRDETKRRVRSSGREGGGEGAQEGSDDGTPFCAVPQSIDFEAMPGVPISVGLRIRLLPQHLPLVVAGDETIGNVLEPQATAMRNCIEEEYMMVGSIQSFDSIAGRGVLKVKGSKSGG
jgi:hypothetical protein